MQLVRMMAQKRISILADNKFISKGGILLSSIGVLLFTVLGLGGCKNVDKKSPQQIFHYNEDVSVTTLDPAFVRSQSENWIVSQIFNGLIDLDAQLQPVPALAKSWEISTDLLTYTFHLRSDVNFCFVDKQGKVTTRKMVASDVAYSLSRIADPATSSPGAWIFVGKIDSQLNRVFIAPNDSTFVLKLVSPAASLLGLLSTNFGYVVPKEYARLDKSYLARNPVGTGPFYVRRWEDEIKLVMRKNPHYHEKDTQGVPLPYLDAINVTFVKNKQTAFMQFAAGSYDFFNGLEGSFKDELLTDQAMLKPKYAQKMKAIITPFLNTEYVGCYLGDYPGKTNWLKDVHLRRALFYAVDKQKLVRFFRNGLGDAGDWGVVPPILNVHEKEAITEANAAWQKALAEYQQSGYAKQNNKPEIVLSTTADYLDMMVYLQETWGRLGVKIKVDIQTGGMLRQLRNEGKLMLFRGSWIADYPDAENFLACYYAPYLSPMGPNYTHFEDAQFDTLYRLIEAGESGQKASLRKQYIQQANQILIDQAPVIPLYYDKSIRLIQPWVQGLENDAANRLVLKRVKISR
ncbi:MAG: ABC transporter substrate-binding protein [Bacteroidetes bacterium]|nr:ABC transporter substrate-binding protein [Bacteroidota bacterium]